MAAGNTSFPELVSLTLEHRVRQIEDAVTEHNALLRALKKMGGIQPAPGGTSIVQPISYVSNQNFNWFEGYEALPIAPQAVHTAVQFPWKNCSVAVTISGYEIMKNAGPDQVHDMLKAKIENAEATMANGLATAVYAAGTEFGGKTLGGLRYLFPTDPTTGVVAGVDRSDAANAWWRNYTSADIADWGTAATVAGYLRAGFLATVRGTDHPDLVVTDSVMWTAFAESLFDIQRITTDEKGTAGFSELAFRGPGGSAAVVFDPVCPANRAYLINLRTLKLRPHKQRNMEVSKPRQSLNQDAQVVHIFWMGNMTTSNAALNGVIWT